MKDKFTREEIREVLKELIQERWTDFLSKAFSVDKHRETGQKLIKKKKKEPIQFAKNVEQWVLEFVDDAGYYNGPPIGHFIKGKFIRNPNDDYTTDDLDTVEEWNLALADYEGFSKMDAYAANTEAKNSLYSLINRSSSFPT